VIVLDKKEFSKLSGLTMIVARRATQPGVASEIAREFGQTIKSNTPGTIKSSLLGLQENDPIYKKKRIKLRDIFL